MKLLLVLGIIVAPIIMYTLQNRSSHFRNTINILSVASLIIFGSIAATSIYQIIIDNAVFMTTIHAIFLNPFFLMTGAYLGLYTLTRLLIVVMNET